jgi:hypothetical protein
MLLDTDDAPSILSVATLFAICSAIELRRRQHKDLACSDELIQAKEAFRHGVPYSQTAVVAHEQTLARGLTQILDQLLANVVPCSGVLKVVEPDGAQVHGEL